MSAAPCPFCGCDLRPVLDGVGRVNAYSHPRAQPFDVDDCFYAGHCIGVGLIPKWNRRAGGVGLGMEVVDGHPVFNLAGKGRLVEVSMVNDTIIYYRRQADEAAQNLAADRPDGPSR